MYVLLHAPWSYSHTHTSVLYTVVCRGTVCSHRYQRRSVVSQLGCLNVLYSPRRSICVKSVQACQHETRARACSDEGRACPLLVLGNAYLRRFFSRHSPSEPERLYSRQLALPVVVQGRLRQGDGSLRAR